MKRVSIGRVSRLAFSRKESKSILTINQESTFGLVLVGSARLVSQIWCDYGYVESAKASGCGNLSPTVLVERRENVNKKQERSRLEFR